MIANKGMCLSLSDQDFFNLLTDYRTELINIVIKHYVELRKYENNLVN